MDSTELRQVARESKRKLDWDRILVLRNNDPNSTQWKWHENARNFSVYTRQEPRNSFAVLGVGTVKASVNEITTLLVGDSQEEYVQKMVALYGKDFKAGSYLQDVEANDSELEAQDVPASKLAVCTATFAKASGWFTNPDDWLYVDALYHDHETGCVEKIATSIKPKPDRNAKTEMAVGGAIAAYRIEPCHQDSAREDPEAAQAALQESSRSRKHIDGSRQRYSSRVHLYGELPVAEPTTRLGALALNISNAKASEKTGKHRLMHLAKACHRISLLIRRRRLGLQVLVDRKRFLPRTNTSCFNCGTSLLVAKLCRVCGQSVCMDCSDKYERETVSRTTKRVVLEDIRVCDPCLDRVESSDYSSISANSLLGPAIVPDPVDAKSADAELRYLLREALVESKSPEHKASVMKVIQYVLEQDENPPPATPSSSGLELPPPIDRIGDFTQALDDLHIESVPFGEADLRSMEDRSYQMDTRQPERRIQTPLAEHEDRRLEAVAKVDINELAESVELNILCNLAANELGCTMSTIAIYDRENLNCVASNVDTLHKAKMPRSDTPCAHTILENKPNLVPHPEADIRFANSEVVEKHGVKFYFAFPIVGDSDNIIGSFCVMNDSSVEVTETKYTAFKKLAETCTKVVRVHTEKRASPRL